MDLENRHCEWLLKSCRSPCLLLMREECIWRADTDILDLQLNKPQCLKDLDSHDVAWLIVLPIEPVTFWVESYRRNLFYATGSITSASSIFRFWKSRFDTAVKMCARRFGNTLKLMYWCFQQMLSCLLSCYGIFLSRIIRQSILIRLDTCNIELHAKQRMSWMALRIST